MFKSSTAGFLLSLASLWLPAILVAQASGVSDLRQPCELGRVHWNRDLEAARRSSAKTGSPVLVLFQEVPGCDTCRNFGSQPLSQPLIVEAIETLFIPVLVYNNKPSDAEVLASFKEPSWNNPVIRYLDEAGKDVIPRKDRVWGLGETTSRMIEALGATGSDVPTYLRMIAAEAAVKFETATLAMHCFWEGEAKLGSLDGVVGTQSAFFDGQEVVRLRFDPDRIDFARLVREASRLECAQTVYPDSEAQASALRQMGARNTGRMTDPEEIRLAPASDQLYYLQHSPMRYVPLTPLQAVKVNAALGLKQKDPMQWLSPRQVALLRRIKLMGEADSADLHALQPPRSLHQLPAYDQRLRELLRVPAREAHGQD